MRTGEKVNEREWVRERQMEEGMRQEIREIMAEWKRVWLRE